MYWGSNIENRTKYTIIIISKGASSGFRFLNKRSEVNTSKDNYSAFLEKLCHKLNQGVFTRNIDFYLDVSTIVDDSKNLTEYNTVVDICAKGEKTFEEIENAINKLLDSIIWRK